MIKNKIDPRLMAVEISSNAHSQNCILYANDYYQAKMRLHTFKNIKIIGEYPFIRAFAVNTKTPDLLDLAGNSWIDYISSVTTASALMQNARAKINVDEMHAQGFLGQGVGVAVIDTGCYPHIDFMFGKKRISKFVDLVNDRENPYDDNGHGTFVSGVLAGNGISSGGKYAGIAPECDLVILKALNSEGQTQAINVLDAMQWVYENRKKYNIRVVCMSFGSTPLAKNDPLSLGASSLWDSGIVVVGAVGNDGPTAGSVKSPGSCAKIITVGCADTTKEKIEIADFSSRGPIFDIIKPDIVAPGVNITSLSNDKNLFTQMSGTSVSTPFVAGVSALILQQNPDFTPNQVKSQIMYSADSLPFSPNDCGMGLLNAKSALGF